MVNKQTNTTDFDEGADCAHDGGCNVPSMVPTFDAELLFLNE